MNNTTGKRATSDRQLMRPELADPSVALRVRHAILAGLRANGGGHLGGTLSCVDILLALFAARAMSALDAAGDALLLSKGHASMALYAVLQHAGVDLGPLGTFGTAGSPLQGHPDRTRLACMDFSSGALGQGVAVGLGMALAREARHVWVVLGDGECQEGMVWEAAMLAARHGVPNLHVVVDLNGEQECGWAHDARLDSTPLPDALAKWRAFGWRADEVDGHDIDALTDFVQAHAEGPRHGPTVLLARTVKGHGLGLQLDRFRRHCTQLSGDEWARIAGSGHAPDR
ncbi:transketolase [Burkholderia cepacia]|uniref:1-deoxy-D-xylulose-5-phosphate synthase N-terminal domain-containing protein n=1 Tax=Burkholderia cepacia TaxID=292 RepID=UPI0008AD9956|nr:1-deoxy-D-xylulose-5-phosphate synthase N-terminal domain-containing protein [Burkholderia cepacia]SEU45961.1 transketolase [Burkholderia cepacia]